MNDSMLPPLYARWLGELLQGPIPEEKEATCLTCPMISCDPVRNKSEHTFSEQTKCCTYWPDIMNFLAGRILNDDSEESAMGKIAFEAAFSKKAILTPMGVSATPSYSHHYRLQSQMFGKNPELLCPYFLKESGLCGIWKHRNSRCATWFCKFNRGSASVLFWKYVDQLLSAIEKILSRWCVVTLDIGPDAMEHLFPPPLSEVNLTADLWGKWADRQREFYRECARLTEELNWNDLLSICGEDLKLYAARLVQQAHAKLITPQLPRSLIYGRWKQQICIAPGMYRIWSYNRYDPIDGPETIVNVLMYFNGEEVKITLQRLEEEKGIRIEPELLQKLTDFGILNAA